MHGEAKLLLKFLDGSDNRYIIPNYHNFSANNGGKSDYLVIDGQQRITTISILFTAMVNLMKSGVVLADDKRLAEKIEKKFLVDEYQTEDRKLRLKPIKDDCVSFI